MHLQYLSPVSRGIWLNSKFPSNFRDFVGIFSNFRFVVPVK